MAKTNGVPRSSAFAPYQGSKTLVVKNLRMTPRVDPEQYSKKVWDQLDAALSSILEEKKLGLSLEELYKGAENLCRRGKAAELHTHIHDKCQNYLTKEVRVDLLRQASQLSSSNLLASYLKAWELWKEKLSTIRSIFFYMDRTYLLRNVEKPNLIDMGRNFFRSIIFQNEQLRPKVTSGVLHLIDSERNSRQNFAPSSHLKKAVAMFQELGTYFSDLDPQFIQTTVGYLRQWAEEKTEKQNLADYAQLSHELRAQELTRCDLYDFDRSTQAALNELMDKWLVDEQHEFLCSAAPNMVLLEANDQAALKHVYALLERRGKGADLAPIFERYVDEQGSAIVFDEKRETEMVVRLLDFKTRLDHIHQHSFNSNDMIGNSLHKAFEHFINKTKKSQANWDTDNAKPGEMIAKHVDLLLKGGVRAIPKSTLSTVKGSATRMEEEYEEDKGMDEEAEINHHLSLALDLFRFVHGKAVFEAFYKKDLARRLLMGRSASDDAERNMLSRLKTECGAGFTHNLESMFKDIDLAKDEMASYQQLQHDRGMKASGPDLNVSVLSSAAWPSYPDVTVTIPGEISKLISDFEYHYKHQHTGRKLEWKHALAHCQLKAHYPRGIRKELVVSGFQAIVLLLFNDVPEGETLSYTSIRAATSLPDPELQRTLQSLACGKYRVLIKDPRGRDVDETDRFAYNIRFSDPKTRIKINQIQLKETKEENKETHIRVAADRHFETQAAIVRIMKSRKTIGHAELVAEVIKATRSRGVLEPADIKRNIDK